MQLATFWIDQRLEEGRQKEWMPRKLNNLGGSILVVAADDETGISQGWDNVRIQTVAAEVKFDQGRRATYSGCHRTGKRTHAPALPRQSAGERDDHLSAGVVDLRVARIGDSRNISSVLDEYVLEPASGTEQRNVVLAGVSNREQGPLETPIRATRRDPHALEVLHTSRRRGELIGCDPRRRESGRKKCESRIDGDMRGEIRVVISNDGDVADTHAFTITLR